MLRRIIKTAVLAVVLTAMVSMPAVSQSERILEVQDVLNRMEDALNRVPGFQANYQLQNGDYTSRGTIVYKSPFFLRMASQTDGSMIISNGKVLWVYMPRFAVVAEQDLITSEREYQLLLTSDREGLRHLRRDYSFQFAPGGRNDANHYILDLRPRVSKIGFKSIRLWVDRETGLTSRVESMTINNRPVNVTFTNLEIKDDIDNNIFWFGVPDGTIQTIRNTILPDTGR